MAGRRVVLIDGTGLAYRAFHALPRSLKTSRGLPTNATYGFAQMFRKVLAGRAPALGAVVFDAPGGTFRTAAEPTYKASRPAMPGGLSQQLPSIDRLVEAHEFPILRVPGVEADDVIATLCTEALEAGHEVLIVSPDKDFYQLVAERVRQLDPHREVTYDPETVYRKTGVYPDRFADWLALVGDKIDDIPGVPGVGKKTAASLLERFGSVSGIVAHADELKGRAGNAVREHLEQLQRSRQLVELRTDVPLEVSVADLVLEPPTVEQLNAAYLELEFYSLLSAEALAQLDKKRAEYFVCDTPELARAALAQETATDEPVALHVLYELPDPLRGDLTGIALSPTLGRGVYLPLEGPGTVLGDEGLDILRPWLEDPAKPKIAHEHKRAIVALRRVGIELRGVVGDSALASYLVDPTKHLPHRIEQVAREYLHVALQPLRGVIGGGRDRRAFQELSVDRAGAYACHLADATGAAWRTLEPRLRDEGQHRLYTELFLPLSRVLADMERTGIAADRAVFEHLGDGLKAQRQALREELHELAGRAFNPGSHKQLGTVLYEDLGLPVLKRTKTGWSVAADVLDRLRDKHPIVEVVLRWRTVDTLVHTYTDVLAAAIADDGRIHATFQQTVSASGRLITTEPDLQRTPVRTEEFRRLREAFVAPDGRVLLSADYSQVELRLLAHLSGDERLVDAYRTGRDVHRQTAAALLDLPEARVNAAQRELGKTVNFATIYGQGAAALARQLGVSAAEARRFLEAFFRTYAGVARWKDEVVTEAHTTGYVTTLLGRRRYVPELSSGDKTRSSYGERIATNTPVQGSGADLCEKAMLDVHRALGATGSGARLVLAVHDELVLEVPEAEVDAVTALVRERMTSVVDLDVPLVVDVGVGRTWAEAH